MLEEIKNKLLELDPNVYYGLADKQNEWNYIVFARHRTKLSENNTGKTEYYSVAVVRENYVEEEILDNLIDKMRKIPGIRIAKEDAGYSCIKKPNTNMVVEIMEVTFCRAVKK